MTTQKSFKVNPDLAEAIELRVKALGMPSLGTYLVSLIREDLIRLGKPKTAEQILKLSWSERDKVDSSILARCKRELFQPPPADAMETLLALVADEAA